LEGDGEELGLAGCEGCDWLWSAHFSGDACLLFWLGGLW